MRATVLLGPGRPIASLRMQIVPRVEAGILSFVRVATDSTDEIDG